MGNSAYKKQKAIEHNENRAYNLKCAAELAQDKIDNPEKYSRARRRMRRKIVPFITTALALSTPTSKFSVLEGDTGPESPDFKEPVTVIKNWEELAQVPCSDTHRLDIVPEDGCGWIKDETGNSIEYLSTHTFYSNNYEYSTRLLQTYGFNVILENWDK